MQPYLAKKLPLILVSLALLVFVTACGGSGSSASAPDAHTLIKNAQAAIDKVKSYHFNLQAENPGTTGTLTIKSADGDTLVPHRLKANATALVFGSVVNVQLIAIDGDQYVTNPLTGAWGKTTGLLDPRSLSDSKTGVSAILGHMQNLSAATDSSVDGTACWSIDGKLDPKYLVGITGGPAPNGKLVAVTTCIGKSDNLPYQIRMTGVAAQGDSDKTVRTFKLSKFGETLDIKAPI